MKLLKGLGAAVAYWAVVLAHISVASASDAVAWQAHLAAIAIFSLVFGMVVRRPWAPLIPLSVLTLAIVADLATAGEGCFDLTYLVALAANAVTTLPVLFGVLAGRWLQSDGGGSREAAEATR